MNAISHLSQAAAIPAYARPAVQTARPAMTGGVNSAARGPAVVFGGALASIAPVSGADAIGASPGVTPVPPVKPVVYRPGAAVNLSI
jgi:hypothetical protein